MTIDVILYDSAVTNFLVSSIIFIITNKSIFVWNNYRRNILNNNNINDSNINDNNNDNNDVMVDKEFIDYTHNDMINTIVVDCNHSTAQQLTHHLKHPKQRYVIDYMYVVYMPMYIHILINSYTYTYIKSIINIV